MTGLDFKKNPKQIDEKQIDTFVANWEMLEELVTEVYSKGQVDPQDRDLYGSLKFALKRYYLQLAEDLRPFWKQVQVAGRSLNRDPFAVLLDTPRLSSIITNWEVMEYVPAAREAIDLMLVAAK